MIIIITIIVIIVVILVIVSVVDSRHRRLRRSRFRPRTHPLRRIPHKVLAIELIPRLVIDRFDDGAVLRANRPIRRDQRLVRFQVVVEVASPSHLF